MPPFDRAVLALRLLGCNPASLGGLWLRARSGPVRERLLTGLDSLPLPVVRNPTDLRVALGFGFAYGLVSLPTRLTLPRHHGL